MRALVLLLVFGLCISCTEREQHTSPRSVTVQPPPNNENSYLVHAMLIRGAGDFGNVNQRWATSVQELVDGGFLSYMLPEDTNLTYRLEGSEGVITSNGHPVYNGIVELPPSDHRLKKLLGTSKTVTVTEFQPDIANLPEFPSLVDEKGQITNKVYNYYGAEWLEKGMDPLLVADAMRFERIRAHLAFANLEFERVYERMPADLSELDAFIGLDRNPAAWNDVKFVDEPNLLSEGKGRFFVGWDGPDFVITANNGIIIEESRFTLRENGRYSGAEWLQY